MKFSPALLVSICALFCPLTYGVVIDLTAPAIKSSITKAGDRRQEVSLATTPDGRQALRLAWNDTSSGYGELTMTPAAPLPIQRRLDLRAQLYVPAGSGLRAFQLRVIDAAGEIFQIPGELPADRHGWLPLTFTIDLANPPADSWGGNDNNVMEVPLAVQGAGFDFRREPAQGHFFLSHLVYEPQTVAGDTVTLIDFASQQPTINLHRAADLRHDYAYGNVDDGSQTALKLSWEKTPANHYEFTINERMPLPTFSNAVFRVSAFFPANNDVSLLNLRLRDKDGEILQYRVPLPAASSGWQDVVFPVNATIANSSSWGGAVTNQRLDFPASFIGIAGDFRSRESTGAMAIGKVAVEVLTDFRPLTPTLETGNPIHVLVPGDASKLGLRINNHKPHGVKARVSYTIRNGRNVEIAAEEQSMAITAGTDFLLPLPAPKEHGVYYVDVVYQEDDPRVEPLNVSYSYAAMQPAGPTAGRGKGFLFGVCSHPQRHPREHQELEAMAAAWCGAKIIREDIDWNRMQPAENQWNFDSFDFTVDAFAKYDIELEAIYSYCARWAVAKDWQPLKPDLKRGARPDYQHWAAFIRGFAERYRGKVHYVEVWNEPDLHGFANFSAEEYIELMKIAYTETKKAAPEMTVMTAGFTCMPPYARLNDEKHMEKTLTLGRGYYDLHAFHGHGPYVHYRNQIERMLPFREKLGVTAPWYANETAISSVHIGDYRQAVTLFQKFLYSWARGSIGYNWYDLRNDGYDPKDGEHNFGLITKDFYPKAAYVAYNALANVYREATYIRDMTLPEHLDGFLFKSRDGDFLLANWNLDSQKPSRLIVLTGISGKASHIDLFGNERPLNVVNQAVVINIDREPGTIRVSGQANEPVVAGDFLEQVDELTVIAGEPKQLAFNIRNPTAFALATDISLIVPDGLNCSNQRQNIELPPGAEALCVFDIAVAKDFRSVPGAQKDITVDARFGALWQGRFACPVNSVTVLENNAKLSGDAHFVLDDAAQNTMLVPNAPDMAKLRWSGPDDLSAKIWLGQDGQQLLIRVVAIDDIHQQPFSGGDVWKGDNVQIAIAVPGQLPFWEIGFSVTNDGRNEVHVWQAPSGFDAAAATATITLRGERDEANKVTRYDAAIPWTTIGLNAENAAQGFRFNLLVNDNDGDVREGFHAVAPGLGTGKNARLFPHLILR